MRTIVVTGPGVIELNYMWLPTFLGMNSVLKREMEAELQKQMTGLLTDAKGLDRAHEIVVEYLQKKFPEIRGLDRFLDAMKYLEP